LGADDVTRSAGLALAVYGQPPSMNTERSTGELGSDAACAIPSSSARDPSQLPRAGTE